MNFEFPIKLPQKMTTEEEKEPIDSYKLKSDFQIVELEKKINEKSITNKTEIHKQLDDEIFTATKLSKAFPQNFSI